MDPIWATVVTGRFWLPGGAAYRNLVPNGEILRQERSVDQLRKYYKPTFKKSLTIFLSLRASSVNSDASDYCIFCLYIMNATCRTQACHSSSSVSSSFCSSTSLT